MAKRKCDFSDDVFYLPEKRQNIDPTYFFQSPLITDTIQAELNLRKNCADFEYVEHDLHQENNFENISEEIFPYNVHQARLQAPPCHEPLFINDPRYILNTKGITRWADTNRIVSSKIFHPGWYAAHGIVYDHMTISYRLVYV